MTPAQQTLIKALRKRWYTSLEAAQMLGVWALSQRYGDLRRNGVCVLDKWVKAYRVVVPTRWTA